MPSIAFDAAFRHTCALPSAWLTVRDLVRLAGASHATRALVHSFVPPWRREAERMQRAQPKAWRDHACARAGIVRRRRSNGVLMPLTTRERARINALPLAQLVTSFAQRVNAPMLHHERVFRYDPVGKVSAYPPGLCRACGRYSKKLVWGGRCQPCFRRDDVELSASQCTKLGLFPDHRRHIPYREVWASGFLSKRYALRVLHEGLARRALPSNATLRAARTCDYDAFRAYIERSNGFRSEE